MHQDILKKLSENFELKSRKGRGGNYSYIDSKSITKRMNEVFAGNWSSEVRDTKVNGNEVVLCVRVYVMDPESEKIFFHDGFGGSVSREGDEAGNVYKSAYSKAIVSACKRWGVGLFLEDESQEIQPHSPTPTSAPAPTQQVVSQQAPAPQQPTPVAQAPVVPATPAAPKLPPTPTPVSAPVQQPTPTTPAQAFTNEANGNKITDVQKVALKTLIDMKKRSYEDIVRGAYEIANVDLDVVPPEDELTYDQAVIVIKHGNAVSAANDQQ